MGADHQAEVAQQAQLTGAGGLLHAHLGGQFGGGHGPFAQAGQDQQPRGVASACSVVATCAAAAASSRARGPRWSGVSSVGGRPDHIFFFVARLCVVLLPSPPTPKILQRAKHRSKSARDNRNLVDGTF